MKIDLARLDALVDMMERRELGELELGEGDAAVLLELSPRRRRPQIEGETEERGVTVTSSRVGIFLKRTSVNADVAAGEMIAEIRVMDVKYQVTSPIAGRVDQIFVEDGMGVEYGRPLIRIAPPQDGGPENV